MEDITIFEAILENDLNPFILFNSNGKMIRYNQEAEFLLNFTSTKELFELAVSNGSKNFGFKQTYLSLRYDKLSFYAILVGYIDEEQIALRLYKVVSNQINSIDKEKLEIVNIFNLLDISKNSTLLNSTLEVEELYDVSIPDLKVNINAFLLTINECFEYFKNDTKISLQVHIKIGEYEIIDNEKYKIVAIEFLAKRDVTIPRSLEQKATSANINIFNTRTKLILELPLIL